jgi:hypothetical protein
MALEVQEMTSLTSIKLPKKHKIRNRSTMMLTISFSLVALNGSALNESLVQYLGEIMLFLLNN